MGCHIAHDRDHDVAIMYCSTTGWAFGPVFDDGEDGHDAAERIEAFLRWLDQTDDWWKFDKEPLMSNRRDPRQLTESGLQAAYAAWLAQEADQWKREEVAVFSEED